MSCAGVGDLVASIFYSYWYIMIVSLYTNVHAIVALPITEHVRIYIYKITPSTWPTSIQKLLFFF
jgi:hypothetical protein